MPNDPKHPTHPNTDSVVMPRNDSDNDTTLDPSARHNARRYAIQAMYQWQLTAAPLKDIENEFVRYQIDKDKKVELDYFKELIHGIPENQDELDRSIRAYIDRPFNEIDPIELAVMRLAIYELIKRPDIPYRVVINEALQLTKKFGSIEGYKFVNGVLDKVARKLRATEVGIGK